MNGVKRNNRIVYFYDDDIGSIFYADGHPMKPHRVKMAHTLILAYDLHNYMRCLIPNRASDADLRRFHSPEYIDFLKYATTRETYSIGTLDKFNIGEDSPIFDGLYQYCQISAGGSIDAARELVSGTADIAINWAGGLHHAKRGEASGFCYAADCVLGILELLERYDRVMYIDIDIHHGDGVEEAFYTTDRVMTVSFHKYGDNFFPGSGKVGDIGLGKGRHYAVNVPLKDGITDENYLSIFKPLMKNLIDWYRPQAILLQCGSDSLNEDRLGTFNLTLKGHAECVSFIKAFGLPLLICGGGGYTTRNVSRCWCYETAVILDKEIDNDLPPNDNMAYYFPDYHLHIEPSNAKDMNSKEDINFLMSSINESVRHLPCAPNVQMCADNPDALLDIPFEDTSGLTVDQFSDLYIHDSLQLKHDYAPSYTRPRPPMRKLDSIHAEDEDPDRS